MPNLNAELVHSTAAVHLAINGSENKAVIAITVNRPRAPVVTQFVQHSLHLRIAHKRHSFTIR